MFREWREGEYLVREWGNGEYLNDMQKKRMFC